MPFRLLSLFAALLLIAGCDPGGDRVVPPGEVQGYDEEQRQALVTALDTLEALVLALEDVEDPMTAWNQAPEVARLLAELERTQGTYALGMGPEAASERYPAEIRRLQQLEVRRDEEMTRILEDPITSRVFLDAMAEAEQADSVAVAG